jgi:alpha-amylase
MRASCSFCRFFTFFLFCAFPSLLLAQPSEAFNASNDAESDNQERSHHNRSEIFYHIFVRSFRDSNGDRIGDLHGIMEKLDYLSFLGITSILLTPLYPSPVYHNYFATSFEDIDAEFGDLKAFFELVKAIHARKMKIYIDQEIQYVAGDHPWFKESLGHPESRYSHYIIYNGPGNSNPESGIFGLSALPTYDGQLIPIATVNLFYPAVRKYYEDLFLSWIDPNHNGRFEDGVDGFRIDHMMDDLDNKGKVTNLLQGFWRPLFARLRLANPKIKIIAEQADWGYGLDQLTKGDADGAFAFPIHQALLSFDKKKIVDAIKQTEQVTPAGKEQLIFIENHDTIRFASAVQNNPAKEKIGAALNVLLHGTPDIYYGQEIGMRGIQSTTYGSDANDIPVREAFKWSRYVESAGSAIWYKDTGPWWTTAYNRNDDGVSLQEEVADPSSLITFYRRLIKLRSDRSEFQSGKQIVLANDQPEVLSILHAGEATSSLLAINLGAQPVETRVTTSEYYGAKAKLQTFNLLSSEEISPLSSIIPRQNEDPTIHEGKKTQEDLQIHLQPFEVKVLSLERRSSPRGVASHPVEAVLAYP